MYHRTGCEAGYGGFDNISENVLRLTASAKTKSVKVPARVRALREGVHVFRGLEGSSLECE